MSATTNTTTTTTDRTTADIRRGVYLLVTAAIYVVAMSSLPHPHEAYISADDVGIPVLSALVALAVYLRLAGVGAFASLRSASRHATFALSAIVAGTVTWFALHGLSGALWAGAVALSRTAGVEFLNTIFVAGSVSAVALTVAALVAARAIVKAGRDR